MESSQRSQNLLLAALPSADFELLRPNLQTIDMPRGLVLVRSGDKPKRAYFPHSGLAQVSPSVNRGQARNPVMKSEAKSKSTIPLLSAVLHD
jgi:hypothetical protein